jgi:hypothetical protein
MVRQSDQEGALLLSNVSRPGNRRIRAPNQLEDQRQHLADEVAVRRTLCLVIGQLGDFAQRVRDRLAQADWHFRRDLIRLLVKRVEIDHNQVNIVFRVAPTFPAPEETIGREGSVLPDCRGILGRVAAQILCTRSIDAERLLCKDPTRRS